MNKDASKRGGARPGAGRKCKGSAPSVTVSLRLPPELRDELRAFLKSRGMTAAQFVEEGLCIHRNPMRSLDPHRKPDANGPGFNGIDCSKCPCFSRGENQL